MGVLKEKLKRDLFIRGYSPLTVEAYARHIQVLANHYRRPPNELSIDNINEYQEHITGKLKYSWSYFNQCVCAMRFFYSKTLRKDWNIKHIPYRKEPKELPEILSKDEIIQLFDAIDILRDKVLFYTIYACGLRVSEVVKLKAEHIDSDRMVLLVKKGKGQKDRIGKLPVVLLNLMREYWRTCRPNANGYFFPGLEKGEPLKTRTVNWNLDKYLKKANITKKITPHSLRHAFATHLLEDGVNIRVIQILLGHRSVRSTEIYTHVSKKHLETVKSPLDTLLGSAPAKEADHGE